MKCIRPLRADQPHRTKLLKRFTSGKGKRDDIPFHIKGHYQPVFWIHSHSRLRQGALFPAIGRKMRSPDTRGKSEYKPWSNGPDAVGIRNPGTQF
jgi:hypothetical protein